jgi:CheY-like chemotaxis protein
MNAKGEASPFANGRILVVEDDIDVSRVVAQMLEHLGYRSVQCGHAQEALEHIRSQKFDLVLIDYRMPDMTGVDLILMLRQDNCHVPVIVMTGYSATEDRISSEKLQVCAVLRKPITVSQLATVVSESLGGKVKE